MKFQFAIEFLRVCNDMTIWNMIFVSMNTRYRQSIQIMQRHRLVLNIILKAMQFTESQSASYVIVYRWGHLFSLNCHRQIRSINLQYGFHGNVMIESSTCVCIIVTIHMQVYRAVKLLYVRSRLGKSTSGEVVEIGESNDHSIDNQCRML